MAAQSFWGSGWGFPPQFAEGGREVVMVTGETDILQSLEILLSTQLKERVMRSSFGSALKHYLFEEIDQGLINGLRNAIRDAILDHEPRIDLDKVEIDASDEREGLVLISISYSVRATNNRFNMVYPFYLNEATDPIL